MDRLLKIEEAAERLGSSERTIRRRIKKGQIPAIQEGGRGARLRFDWDAELAAIQAHFDLGNTLGNSREFSCDLLDSSVGEFSLKVLPGNTIRCSLIAPRAGFEPATY